MRYYFNESRSACKFQDVLRSVGLDSDLINMRSGPHAYAVQLTPDKVGEQVTEDQVKRADHLFGVQMFTKRGDK